MTHLIDKAAVVAEIERLKEQLIKGACASQIAMETRCKEESYNEVLSFLNTIEAKEVDLKEEFEKYYRQERYIQTFKLAKHFFELGMAVSNKQIKEKDA